MRLIDADKIDYTMASIYWGKDEDGNDVYRRTAIAIESEIDKMPTADVEEVKQGEWVSDRCTNCGKLNPTLDFNEYLMRYYSFYLPRCPYCGAYMKKE